MDTGSNVTNADDNHHNFAALISRSFIDPRFIHTEFIFVVYTLPDFGCALFVCEANGRAETYINCIKGTGNLAVCFLSSKIIVARQLLAEEC